MRSANLDFVRSLFAAWERGDFSSAEWAHPEIEFVIADGPSPGSWRRLAGMAEGFRNIVRGAEGFRPHVEEYRELDNERVLVLAQQHGRGKTSGLDLAQIGTKGATLLHLRDGKVTRLVLYFDHERALADLGLSSEAGSPRS